VYNTQTFSVVDAQIFFELEPNVNLSHFQDNVKDTCTDTFFFPWPLQYLLDNDMAHCTQQLALLQTLPHTNTFHCSKNE